MPASDDQRFLSEPVDKPRNGALIERKSVGQFADRPRLAVEQQGHHGPLRHRQPEAGQPALEVGFDQAIQSVMPVAQII